MSKKARKAAKLAAATASKNSAPKTTSPAAVVKAPIQAPVAQPVVTKLNFSAPKATPAKVTVPPPITATGTDGQVICTMVALITDRNGKPLFGRLRDESGKYYTASAKVTTLPEEGEKVVCETYEYEGNPAVRIISKTNTVDELTKQKSEFLKKQSLCKIVFRQDYVGSSDNVIDNPDVIGVTPEGHVILYVTNPD